ncbi:hypothetical protein ACTFIZ_011452 [Dictyostelium cf. discoideum]
MNSLEFKAGMEKVDIESINSMLKQFSVGTHFQEKLERDSKRTREYIEGILSKLNEIPDTEEYQEKVDSYLTELTSKIDQSRTFIHIDMDAFYANVEEMDNKELIGHPVAVGSIDMLVTSNYTARAYGVRSGLPGLLAMKLCPHLIILPSRMDRYREVSSIIRNILYKYDKNYVSPSLDEGCIDITEYLKDNENLTGIDIANQLQNDIFEKTTLTCSMGISCSPLLSKISSEINKPNGYFYLDRQYSQEFIKTIQIKKLPGIGKVRQELLKTLGLEFVSDIIEHRYELYYLLPEQRDLLFKHALAIPIFPNKSSFRINKKKTMISKEKNCKELYDEKDLEDLMKSLFDKAIEMLLFENKYATTLIVKVQDFSFKVINYSYQLILTTTTTTIPLTTNSIPTLPIITTSTINSNNNNDDDISTEEKECITKEEEIDSYYLDSPPSSPSISSSSSSSSSYSFKQSPCKLKKTFIYPNNFNEHSEKIWKLFINTTENISFEKIRCIGLKLINLINIPSIDNLEN